MGIPPRDFQGAVGTVGNLLLVFHGFHGPVFSTALRFRCLPGRRKSADHVGAVADRHIAVQVFMDGDRTSGQGTAKATLFQLPVLISDGDGVVLGHHALSLHGKDPIQIRPRRFAKRKFCGEGRRRPAISDGSRKSPEHNPQGRFSKTIASRCGETL